MQKKTSEKIITFVTGIPGNLWDNKAEILTGAGVGFGLRFAFGAAAVAMLSPVVPVVLVPAALGVGFGAAVGVVREAGWGKRNKDEAVYQRWVRAIVKGAAFGAGSAIAVGWFLDAFASHTAAAATTTPQGPVGPAVPLQPVSSDQLASASTLDHTVATINQTTGLPEVKGISPYTMCSEQTGWPFQHEHHWYLLNQANDNVRAVDICQGTVCTPGSNTHDAIFNNVQYDDNGSALSQCPIGSFDITKEFNQNLSGLQETTRLEGATPLGRVTVWGYVQNIYDLVFKNGLPSCEPPDAHLGVLPVCASPQP
jgi:hypothetical protein